MASWLPNVLSTYTPTPPGLPEETRRERLAGTRYVSEQRMAEIREMNLRERFRPDRGYETDRERVARILRQRHEGKP